MSPITTEQVQDRDRCPTFWLVPGSFASAVHVYDRDTSMQKMVSREYVIARLKQKKSVMAPDYLVKQASLLLVQTLLLLVLVDTEWFCAYALVIPGLDLVPSSNPTSHPQPHRWHAHSWTPCLFQELPKPEDANHIR